MRCNCHTLSRLHTLWLVAQLIWVSTLMLPSAVLSDKTAADYFVTHLPGAPSGPLLKMHAGHVEVDSEHSGHLFFWHFANRHIANRQRTVIWLNGGPGCSSMDGVLMEIGPYRVQDRGKLEYSNGSWDEFANLLFVDNPVGTGFSYVDTDSFIHELDVMANQFIIFMEKWFAMFPQYLEDDIYIAGESYAGQHIPYISKAILKRNKDKTKTKWNLQGIMIGNGWISPVHQYLEYVPFAKKHFIQEGSDAARRVENQQAICIKALDDGGKDHVDSASCEQLLQDILKETKSDGNCVNMYDVRLTDSYPSCGMNWPPDLENVTPYLRRNDVISALHINPDKNTGWTECSGAVGESFKAKKSSPSIQLLPDLLKDISILLFSGDQDLICNHLGTEELIHNLEWNGAKGFELSPGTWAPRRQWTFEGEAAGMYQYARNLTYLLFYNSSHMVPFDYPRRTRDMLDRFIGVDIGIIGGTPADSRIDGEKGPQTSVGGHPNSDAAEKAEHDRLEAATRGAYYRSGGTVFIIIILVAACGWGFYMWRSRDRNTKYGGLPHQRHDSVSNDHLLGVRAPGSDFFRQKRPNGTRDVEAADFDETALEDLRSSNDEREDDRYSVGGVSSDEEDNRANEGPNGSTLNTS